MARLDEPVGDLITTDEVLERLEAHPSLRRDVASCVLQATHVGNVVYFRRLDLEAWIERQLRVRQDREESLR